MKFFKLALLGTAALAAASMSARAENLDALKAQIEALNARVASMEATPAVPAGYAMVSFSKVGDEHIISIMPTADAPAAAPETKITWTGNVAAGVMTNYAGAGAFLDSANTIKYATDVWTSLRMKVVAQTETAVGQVGVSIGLRTDVSSAGAWNGGNQNVLTDGFYGWWKLTPNLTFSGGMRNPIQKGTLAKNSYSFDAICSCYQTDSWGAISNAPYGKGNGLSDSSANNPAQLTLTYADGPIGLAVQVEDGNNAAASASAFGASAKATYKMDMVGFDMSAGYWGNTAAGGDASWAINGGAGLNLAPVKLGATVGVGHVGLGSAGAGKPSANYDYAAAGGYATVALSDSASIELGAVYDFGTAPVAVDKYAGAALFNAGIYYTPVKQLLIGLEGQYQTGGLADQAYTANLVSVFKF